MTADVDSGDDEALDLVEAWLADALPAEQADAFAARVAARPALAARVAEVQQRLALADELFALVGSGGRGDDGGGSATATGAPPELADYAVLGELARGGQGLVWRARQRSTGRDVAVKVLHAGADSARERLRFEREIEAVASLNHPHVVAVFDRGVSADGRPFVVMELVHGVPFDRWLDDSPASLRERLAVFEKVCAAVAYAHRHGVIHRDLKPANVLVDDAGEPRVLDFGLAKRHDREQSLLTRSGEFLGTLAYSAPEQLQGDPEGVDARVDVYALGVLLYRLLSGSHPLPLDGSPASVVQHVLEVEPPPPSQRAQGLDGDLDALVLTCLAKDPDERYPTVEALRADLRRWHVGEPLVARSGRRGYVLRKTLRRYRASVAALAVVLVTLGVSTAVALGALAETRREARRAHDLSGFLVDSLAAAAPGVEPRDRTVVDLMGQAARDVGARFVDDPASEGVIRATIAHVLRTTGTFDEAERHGQAALALLEESLGADSRATLQARRVLAELAHARGDLELADARFASLSADARDVLAASDVEHAALVRSLAALRITQGRGAEVVPLVEAALAALSAELGPRDADVLSTRLVLAEVLRAAGRTEEALALLADVSALRTEVLGPDHAQTLSSRNNQANLLAELGRGEEAAALFADVAARLERLAGPGFAGTLQAQANHAAALVHLRRADEASSAYRSMLDVARERLGARHPITLQALHGLGVALKSQQDYAGAAALFEEARAGRLALLGEDHPDTIRSTIELAVSLGPGGDLQRVEELLRDGLARAERVFGRDATQTLSATHTLAVLLLDTGRVEAADALWSELVPRARAALGDDAWHVWNYAGQHALALLRLGRLDAGRALGEQAWDGLAASLGPSAAHTRAIAGLLVQAARAADDAEAEALWAERAAAD